MSSIFVSFALYAFDLFSGRYSIWVWARSPGSLLLPTSRLILAFSFARRPKLIPFITYGRALRHTAVFASLTLFFGFGLAKEAGQFDATWLG